MKKILTLILTAAFMLIFGMTASAAAGGTITVDNARINENYDVYRILDLSTDATGTKFTYTIPVSGEWDAFYEQENVKAILNIDTVNNVVTWKDGVEGSTGAAALAKLALAYVQQNTSINAAASKTADSSTVEFTGLDYGYYLLNTSVGSVCSLDSNNQAVVINDKHGSPAVEKQVGLDGTSQYDSVNSAEIGDVINFKAALTNINDVNNLVFTDTMSNGLTFNKDSLTVACNGTVIAPGTATYSLVTGTAAPNTFEVRFADGHHDLTVTDSIVITYTATVNSSAVIGGNGNANEAKLTYGNSQESSSDTTATYVYGFSIKKTDSSNNSLAGAQFVISRGTANKEYAVISNGKLTGWTTTKTDANLTSPADGLIAIEGLAAGTYYIEETKAPNGYNKLSYEITVVIAGDGSVTANGNAHSDKIIEIVNSSGAQLPGTGGVGKNILITVGMMGVIVMGVFLVTNKRMKKEGF